MSPSGFEWILFDADGTLFDYDRAEQTALQRALEQAGVLFQPEFLLAYRKINSSLWRALEQGQITPEALKTRRFELLFESAGIAYPARDFGELYLRCLADCAELVSGALETVRSLHKRYRLAIVTNGLKKVQRPRLERSPLRNFIRHVLISEELGCAKPAAAFFDETFKRIGHPDRDRVLMVGDNWSSDIVGAAAYGIACCWFNPGNVPRPATPPITFEIRSLPELLPHLV